MQRFVGSTQGYLESFYIFLGQRSLSDICIVSADLFQSVFAVPVKRCAELLLDNHMLYLQLGLEKRTLFIRMDRTK